MFSSEGLLFIEPKLPAANQPIIDDLTIRMNTALRQGKSGIYRNDDIIEGRYRGFHRCACGAMSDSQDHLVLTVNGHLLTNSLATHYLAYHRAEVSEAQLNMVRQLPSVGRTTGLRREDIKAPA
jgi:hypothetical protein